jgi:non-heme chloroperoxidase
MPRGNGRLILGLCVALALGGCARDLPPVERVAGGGGLNLAIYESGNADGPPILFLHGFTGTHRWWEHQMTGPLAETFRLIAMDLRGHGASDKPLEAPYYTDTRLWAEDVAAVIRAKGLDRPVLVGWSYGGLIMADYLRHFGEQAIGGLVFVGVNPNLGSEESMTHLGPELLQMFEAVVSEDTAIREEATRRIYELTLGEPADGELLDAFTADGMKLAPSVRLAMFSRELDNDDVLSGIGVPTLVIQGARDRVVLMPAAEDVAATVPGARLLVYEDAAHAPFFTDPDRFNRDLAEFVRGAR